MDAFAVGTTAALAVLCGAFVVGARTMGRKMEERFALLAPPLCAEISGTARNYAFSGTYAGAPVRAKILRPDDEGGRSSHQYELTRDGDAGDADWKLSYGTASGWNMRSADAALVDAFARAGVLAALERWPTFPSVRYAARKRRITYSEQVADHLAFPDAQTFRDQLELLDRLAVLAAAYAVPSARSAASAPTVL